MEFKACGFQLIVRPWLRVWIFAYITKYKTLIKYENFNFINSLTKLGWEWDINVNNATPLFTQTSPSTTSLKWTEWIELDQNKPKCTKTRKGPKWIELHRMAQSKPNWTEIDQSGPKCYAFTWLKWFLDLDCSTNRKRERFKVFKVELWSNHDNVIINLIII